MTLEQAIHERWAATDALAALMPAERLTTGRASGALPYATLLRQESRPLAATNGGVAVEELSLRLRVWHADHDAGRAVVDAAKTALDGAEFYPVEGARLARLRRQGEAAFEHEDGTWRFTVRYRVYLYCFPGV
jgi:hypothetical protein